jgi:hypothetical protein
VVQDCEFCRGRAERVLIECAEGVSFVFILWIEGCVLRGKAFGRFTRNMVANGFLCNYRSLLYVDADARMESFTDKDGNQRSNLSLIASTYTCIAWTMGIWLIWLTGNFEILSRPRNEEATDANDEGLVQEGSA